VSADAVKAILPKRNKRKGDVLAISKTDGGNREVMVIYLGESRCDVAIG